MDAIVDEDILGCLVSNALLVSMIYVTRHIGALWGRFFCSRERTGSVEQGNGRVWFTFREFFSEGILHAWHIKRSLFAKIFHR